MQFVLAVIEEFLPGGIRADEDGSATPAEAAAIDEFNSTLEAEGHLVFAGGLAAPARATVVDSRDGAAVEIAGSLFPSETHYGGFWVIEAASEPDALALARGASAACNRRIELRPLLG